MKKTNKNRMMIGKISNDRERKDQVNERMQFAAGHEIEQIYDSVGTTQCIGVCKRRYGLDLVMMRLKHTSEIDIHAAILTRNLFRRLRLLFWLIWRRWWSANSRGKTGARMVPVSCLCG